MSDNMIKISMEDAEKLKILFYDANTTPCIKMTSDPNEKDFSTLAWDKVRDFQIELGSKYGYDWTKHAINFKTCIVKYIGDKNE